MNILSKEKKRPTNQGKGHIEPTGEVKPDLARAKAILSAQVEAARLVPDDEEWVKRTNKLAELSKAAGSIITVLGTALLARATHLEIDPLTLKGSGEGSYSARSFSKNTIAGLSQDLGYDHGVRGTDPLAGQPFFRESRVHAQIETKASDALTLLISMLTEIAGMSEEELLCALRGYLRARLCEEPIEDVDEPEAGGWEGYPLDELAIRDERRTAVDVVRRIEQGRFVMDPDFQRGFVWSKTKQSRLIESILLRIPLPTFYVAEDAEGKLIVVDGRQRLSTLQRFTSGELQLKLPDRPELDGFTFDDLDARLQNRVEDCQLLFYIIDHSVPERARLDIFERVNGGEVLTRQQMRNAIHNGPATVFLREEADTKLFRKATGGSLNKDKMQDREFVNRFVSFSLLPLDEYKGDMDKWLAEGLIALSKLPEAGRKRLSERFRRTLANNYAAFGKHAFRKHRRMDQPRSLINASLYDVMAHSLADLDQETVEQHTDQLRQALYKRFDDPDFNKAITYGPNTQVRKRFRMAEEMMREVFDA